jgi:hypothetical protein
LPEYASKRKEVKLETPGLETKNVGALGSVGEEKALDL